MGKSHQHIQVVEWRAYLELVQISNLLTAKPLYNCIYIPREENERANQLANQARSQQMTCGAHLSSLV